jgi:hypothetical protein
MNKKTLFLILLGAILAPTTFVSAAAAAAIGTMATSLENAAIAIATPIVVIGWIIAGILYLTSAGGSQMETAKKALIACVVGTVLVVLAIGSNAIMGVIKQAFGLS